MRTIHTTILTAVVASAALGGELAVSPDGLSPHDAILTIRAAKANGDKGAWTVRVKEGLYTLNETLVFTPEDSGDPDVPVTWIGEGEKTVFAGGQRLTGWKDIGGGVWSAPIPSAPDGRPAFFEQLWVNGRRADRARFPDSSPAKPIDGYLQITSATISPVTNENGKVTYIERTAVSNAAELASIPADELAWAQMCIVHKWSFARRVIKGMDASSMTVETHSPYDWILWKKWDPSCTIVWFENVRSAFDSPGEWFYDAKNGAVLYRPLPDEDMSRAEVVAPSSGISRLVEFRGDPDGGKYVHDMAFKGISFSFSSATSDTSAGPTQAYQLQAAKDSDGAVTATGVRQISFDGCTVSHTGNYGMRFNDGCTSNAVTNCELDDLGAGGVWMGAQKGCVAKGETLSRRVITTLAPRSTAFNRIENCLIRGGGKFNPEGAGVAFTHVSDSKVLHCDIHDFYYTGVSAGWTWGFMGSVAQRNEIAFNKIYDLGKGVMSDMGGVYTLGTSFGTTVHDNVIHDVWAYSYGGWALYCDEGSEGIVMERNLCWNTTDGGFHQHYGAGCIIRNNIFAWNRKLGAVRTARQVVQDIPCTLHFVNNIVVVKEGPLVGVGPRGVGGVWAGNLWYDYSGKPKLDGLDWNDWKNCGKEIGGAYADPCFVDADANDFRLKPESPAFALGFRPWDYSAIAQGVTADSNDVLMANGIVVDGKVCRETERRDFADGFAVRYLLPDGVCTVSCERTEWVVPENAKIWYQPLCMEYEHPYVSQMVGRIAAGTLMNMPVTLKLSDGSYRLLTEANVVNHSDASLEYCGGGRFAIRYAYDKNGFKRPGGASPWRVTLVAKDLQTLATSDIVRRLCPDPSPEVAAKCAAFVKGGRSVWQWLPAGDPKYGEQKEWYDRTKALGFEYYLVDDGWKVWRDGDMDQWACLKKWIDYGKSIGVESFVWVDSKEMRTTEARRAYLKKVKACGAVGIKIDFVPEPSCSQMRWYEETLADTLEFSLMTDFHGCVKPSGRERTWPHEVAREAIRGHEWHITRYNRVLPPEHDCILPFNRLVQGHADYTPMVFEKKELQGFTWARELAQGVVFSAPFLCFGDYPQNYLDNPAAELIKSMPAEYDETRILPGSEIGKCVAVAKRKGRDWFVAVENGAEGRRIAVKLDFLGADNCELLGFADAEDRPDGYRIDRRVVGRDGKIELTLRPCGGYCARISPTKGSTFAN